MASTLEDLKAQQKQLVADIRAEKAAIAKLKADKKASYAPVLAANKRLSLAKTAWAKAKAEHQVRLTEATVRAFWAAAKELEEAKSEAQSAWITYRPG